MKTSINGKVALVTGANGGLGSEFVQQLLDRGARKVYAAARTPKQWADPRVTPLTLDVTDAASIATAAATAHDVSVLINNAGITIRGPLLTQSDNDIRAMFDTNFFGAINVVRALAPALQRNGPSALIDVHSVMSWLAVGGAYSASKAALWSATNTFRLELDPHGVHVLGLHLSYTETPMTQGLNREMATTDDVVDQALRGLEDGSYEVLTDQETRDTKHTLSQDLTEMYPHLTPNH